MTDTIELFDLTESPALKKNASKGATVTGARRRKRKVRQAPSHSAKTTRPSISEKATSAVSVPQPTSSSKRNKCGLLCHLCGEMLGEKTDPEKGTKEVSVTSCGASCFCTSLCSMTSMVLLFRRLRCCTLTCTPSVLNSMWPGHVFCRPCIEQFATRHKKCPLCNRRLLKGKGCVHPLYAKTTLFIVMCTRSSVKKPCFWKR